MAMSPFAQGGDDVVDFLPGQGEVTVDRGLARANGLEINAGCQPQSGGQDVAPVVMAWLRATVNL